MLLCGADFSTVEAANEQVRQQDRVEKTHEQEHSTGAKETMDMGSEQASDAGISQKNLAYHQRRLRYFGFSRNTPSLLSQSFIHFAFAGLSHVISSIIWLYSWKYPV